MDLSILKNKYMNIFRCFLLIINAVLFCGCANCKGDGVCFVDNSKTAGDKLDKKVASYQERLLELAFDTASVIPVNPHIKDRSRAQEKVVLACLELEQPKRAAGYIEKIEGWRQGLCYAQLAFYYAERGVMGESQKYVTLAEEYLKTTEDWRKDRIKVKIAQVCVLLNNGDKAVEYEKGVVESETGKVIGTQAMVLTEGAFNEQLKKIDELVATGDFDVLKNTLESCTQLYGRFYKDKQKRALVEEKIKGSWVSLPVFIRIELLTKMGHYAVENTDKDKAKQLADEAQGMLNKYQWPLEYQVQMGSKILSLRYCAGDKERASNDADTLKGSYKKGRGKIVNIYRAGSIRPLAEAYHKMGDMEAGLSVYKQAIEEGVCNPNSRPRAEDLSATCCSMAVNAVEPDEEIWKRLNEIRKGLGNPW